MPASLLLTIRNTFIVNEQKKSVNPLNEHANVHVHGSLRQVFAL